MPIITQHSKICVRIAHGKTGLLQCGGKWHCPYIHVCRMFFKQKRVGHRTLSTYLWIDITLFQQSFSPCLLCSYFLADVFMLKIVSPICCGMDVHKSFVCAYIVSINTGTLLPIKANAFLLLLKTGASALNSSSQTTVRMSVLNLRESTESLPSTFSNNPAVSFMRTQSILKSSKVKKRQKGRTVDRKHLQIRSCFRKFYAVGRYPSSSRSPLSLQADQIHLRPKNVHKIV